MNRNHPRSPTRLSFFRSSKKSAVGSPAACPSSSWAPACNLGSAQAEKDNGPDAFKPAGRPFVACQTRATTGQGNSDKKATQTVGCFRGCSFFCLSKKKEGNRNGVLYMKGHSEKAHRVTGRTIPTTSELSATQSPLKSGRFSGHNTHGMLSRRPEGKPVHTQALDGNGDTGSLRGPKRTHLCARGTEIMGPHGVGLACSNAHGEQLGRNASMKAPNIVDCAVSTKAIKAAHLSTNEGRRGANAFCLKFHDEKFGRREEGKWAFMPVQESAGVIQDTPAMSGQSPIIIGGIGKGGGSSLQSLSIGRRSSKGGGGARHFCPPPSCGQVDRAASIPTTKPGVGNPLDFEKKVVWREGLLQRLGRMHGLGKCKLSLEELIELDDKACLDMLEGQGFSPSSSPSSGSSLFTRSTCSKTTSNSNNFVTSSTWKMEFDGGTPIFPLQREDLSPHLTMSCTNSLFEASRRRHGN